MVYSQMCSWLHDFIGQDPPEELLDVWDLTEWLYESEIIDIFFEIVVPTFKNKRSRDDAEDIVHSLLWEYFLFRRDSAVGLLTNKPEDVMRIKELLSCKQQSGEWHMEKRDLVTASEFSDILDNNRTALLRKKVKAGNGHFVSTQTVFLTKEKRIHAMAWGFRFEPVVRAIYEKVTGNTVFTEVGRVRHPLLKRLAASPDGLVDSGPGLGRLLEIKAPVTRALEEDIIPYEYYCQMQVQMEVLDVGAVDYCECRISSVTEWSDTDSSLPQWIGAVAVVGVLEDPLSWAYVYSPLFSNTEEGRLGVDNWTVENCLEKQKWIIQDWQLLPVLRNRRWWLVVGLPEYEQFIKDLDSARVDPLFFTDGTFDKPMFIDC